MKNKNFYIENYGCQMNISDSDIITSILLNNGFFLSKNLEKSDIILLNACSIREKAEFTLKKRLEQLKFLKKKKRIWIGIIGCFSKTIKNFFIHQKIVDFFVKPDSYREIPNFIYSSMEGKQYFSTVKNNETYADISLINSNKQNHNKITTFLSITRGCNNMCTFCIVPFTRGRERSRDPYSIIKECKRLYQNGYKEITLLGQNVDSYVWEEKNEENKPKKPKNIVEFSKLLDLIAQEVPFMRIRFSTSNPHDMSNEVLKVISKHENICKHIHLPVQSGSNKILKLMNRKYTREKYLLLVKQIKDIIPECSISHDIISGFCNENEEDHQDTINLMNEIKYNYGYMFSYSPRPGTYAYRKLKDNVPEHIKKNRLREIIDLQRNHSFYRMQEHLGKIEEVLIEGVSKKNNQYWYGRNTQNLVVVFPKESLNIGDISYVKIIDTTSATLIGKPYK
ncbi:(Dimethylallyl)adenosine tRNA methylthiotransferase miaB [Blattabacterium sp. (Nauphoeta cinerea)]|uniref:tRNA (N6-isopentenyl adenosine(37)-C2)-methylthiotransferase MiaB n=1 Tax=Blattabacterium sp. (Nauphoeta cinerea) TaxID=1316444 RepID=UPI0003B08FC1|nr:tRNA (N6-isopentenyl adenosine(37)-C2)-methylthiotransferase MiaB [Blattabacterium sp. (Nauphoeta cinerea)]AGW85977.1 (Dimethylallyl)adenosine tRNA methylthiotransferase miaB [Blattabacterium sp. (Nauphoeta cinerea)]